MHKHHTSEDGYKYKPDYKWPDLGTIKNCPRCDDELELIENKDSYFGKPWWCAPCQWQFSEEDLATLEEKPDDEK
jgi:transposase-like protein